LLKSIDLRIRKRVARSPTAAARHGA
jgi:hypothetical protein